MLIWIAVANAVLWSGVFLALLLVLMRGTDSINAQVNRLEDQLGVTGDDELLLG